MKETAINTTLKSTDTEEWLDIHFTRPLGFLWARFFNHYHVHPNVVTILSIILGIAAGILFYFENFWLNVLGILLLIWANIYDSCDGQLARMSGKKTRLGRVLDGFAGDVWFVTIYAAICLRLMPQNIPFTTVEWGIWIWLLCALAGLVCHGKQSQLADYYRNIHLYFIKGKEGSELDNSATLRTEYNFLKWQDDPIWKVFLFFYARYTRGQEQMTPLFQQMFQTLRKKYSDKSYPKALTEEFCAKSRKLMPLTNILTFNTRAIALYAGLLLSIPVAFPLFEIIILTPIYIYMHRSHEKLCADLESRFLTES